MSQPRIEIDLDAIRSNVEHLRSLAGVPVMAIVKANGYGHGALEVARAAIEGGADALGVVDVREALALRDGGIRAPILAWLHDPATDWLTAIERDIDLGVSSIEQLEMLATAAERTDRPARIHVKVDTGLGRNGALERDWGSLFTLVRELEQAGTGVFAGLFSHFSGTSSEADGAQLAALERARRTAAQCGLQPERCHLAASAGTLDYPEARLDLVRLGIAMYGLTPYSPDRALELPLRAALRVLAPVIVGPDGEARIELGTVDGLPPLDAEAAGRLRAVDARGVTWRLGAIGDVATPVERVGPRERAGGAPDGPAGDTWLTILGGDASSADEWAAAANTIGYEIVTRLSARLERRRAGAIGAISAPARPADAAVGIAPEGTRAPRRELVVDLDRLREGLDRHAASGTALDVSADAYGLGVDLVAPIARARAVELVVRRTADAERWPADLGAPPRVDPQAAPDTRDAYGFGGAGCTRLASVLVHVKRVAPGQGVSYGYEWIASTATTLGLVPMGYGDALPRRASGHAHLRVLGEAPFDSGARATGSLAPVVGRVAMDQVVVDLHDTEAWAGAPVILYGSEAGDPPLTALAAAAGLSPEAFVAALGPRVQRGSIGEPEQPRG